MNDSRNVKNRICMVATLTLMTIFSIVLLSACGQKKHTRVISVSADLSSISELGAYDGRILDSVSMLNASVTSVSNSSLITGEKTEEEVEGLSEEQQTVYDEYMQSLADKEIYYTHLIKPRAPEALTGVIYEGYNRDIFFANGTPITIAQPDADVSDCVLNEAVQDRLGNGLGPDNRGYGAVIIWEEGGEKNYCIVSNMAEVFGGSYRDNLESDVNITIDGSEATGSYPNVSFLFGGGMQGDVVGDININISNAQCMYVYGGSYNGDVIGNINITSSEKCWIMETTGGGLAFSGSENVHANVFGNITVNMLSEALSKSNCVIGGGLAYSDTKFVAAADVHGDISVNIMNQKLYEVCGGGLAYKVSAESGYSMSNVYGNTSVSVDETSIVYDDRSSSVKSGIVAGGGMAESSVALVSGSASVYIGDVTFDRKATGVFYGGVASEEFDEARANVYGDSYTVHGKENYRYSSFDAANISIANNNMNNALKKIFQKADSSVLPDTLKDLSEDIMADIEKDIDEKYSKEFLNKIDSVRYNSIYTGDIYSMLVSDTFDDYLLQEKPENMMRVDEFFPDDRMKRNVKIYYPKPSNNYIWRGNE